MARKSHKSKTSGGPDDITGVYEVFDAVRGVFESADPVALGHLALVMNEYSKDFPEEFFWAIGAQSPMLLHGLMMEIDAPILSEKDIKAAVASKMQAELQHKRENDAAERALRKSNENLIRDNERRNRSARNS